MIQVDTLKSAGICMEDIQKLENAWTAFHNAQTMPQRTTPHIVCTGIYNAGKSTLLNALVGREIFPTGDVPTTKKITRAEFEGAMYIDTPGLNAMEEDDRETQAAYETADFVLFVSSAQNGGISEAEAVWLQKLKERYGSLQQRLIYVLTHCTQVEQVQLPAIREQFHKDFLKAVEFEPEEILCVDSITYQRGKREDKAALVEHSGILQMQTCLAKRIVAAEITLRDARKAEQSEILKILKKMREQCQQQIKECSNHNQRNEIDRLLKEAERKIKAECEPSVYIGDTYVYHSPSKTRFKRMGVTSPFSVEKDAKDGLNRYAAEYVSKAKRKLDECMREVRKYYTAGIDSPYFKTCSAVNGLLEDLLSSLQRNGVRLSRMEEIHAMPDADDLAYLQSAVNESRKLVCFYEGKELFDTYYDVFGNRFVSHDITDWVTKKTLFGEKLVEVVGTEIDAYYAMNEAENQIHDEMTHFKERIVGDVEYAMNSFLRKLQSEASRRLSEFRKAAEASLSAAEQEVVRPYQNAVSILLNMEDEVKQWQI